MGKSNQKTVKVKKEPCNKDNYYTTINLNALSSAAKQLSGDAFKMWVYFSKNQNNYEFNLSSQHAIESFSLSKRRYDNAIKELTTLGFLVDTNTDPDEVINRWTFYEDPLTNKEDKPLQQNDTSLEKKEYKPSSTVDTRNNTENTIKTMQKSIFPEGKVVGWDNMTEKQKKDYYAKHIF